MNTVIQKGINPILNQYDYPDLMVKIGVDFGQNIVVRYGADEINSHVDLDGTCYEHCCKNSKYGKTQPNFNWFGCLSTTSFKFSKRFSTNDLES